jgi:nickel-dependent lactate racemase
VAEVAAAGIDRRDILILVATGLHRPNDGQELREVVGSDDVFESVPIANHFARDREAHVDLGRTPSGIPILIDRRFVEADLRIVVGLVEPHFMAGYSGGRKLVVPGVAHQDTILKLHAGVMLDHPRAANTVLEGNPLHAEQLHIVRAIGEISALNVVIDEERRIGFVNFGEVEASHAEAVAFMRRYGEVSVPGRFETVVTTSAGYPLDKTYYQTVKGMVTPLDILEPGGTLIVASACSEGFGSREFRASQAHLVDLGPDAFLQTLLAKRFADVDEWQSEMQLKPMRAGRVQLYTTGLGDDDRRLTGVENVGSVESALAAALARAGDTALAVVPEGPYVVPVVA